MKNNNKEKEKLKKLNDMFVAALSYGEDEKIPVALTLQIAGHNLAEFGLWQTRGDITSVVGLLLHSFEYSVMRRTNTETLAEIEQHIRIDIDMGHEIFGREDEATVVLLSSFFRSVEAMIHQYDRCTQSLH